jgi:hypothetical protein
MAIGGNIPTRPPGAAAAGVSTPATPASPASPASTDSTKSDGIERPLDMQRRHTDSRVAAEKALQKPTLPRSRSDEVAPRTKPVARSLADAGRAYRTTFERFASPTFDPTAPAAREEALGLLLTFGRHSEGLKTASVEQDGRLLLAGSHDLDADRTSPPQHPVLLTTVVQERVKTAVDRDARRAAMELFAGVSGRKPWLVFSGTRLYVTTDAGGAITNLTLGASTNYGVHGAPEHLATVARWHRNLLDAAGVTLDVKVAADSPDAAPLVAIINRRGP